MRFRSLRAVSQLMRKGVVATMRNGKYHDLIGREIVIRDSRNIVFAKARVIAVFENLKVFRKLLWKYSGFESLEAWEEKARELNMGRLPKYIVLLKLTEKLKTDPLCGFESAKELLKHTV
ncbi:hypothetical protein [Archaeoglobus profundus]|uniref:ASCH domain-containing protein n=1 Tax=Archaeoglobus profundus (strain DSM 5631 / JCM 9629 / NBRC 100127 / Av18) TaxID=572546 RepID=D2RFW6_ARCPA|nr:hypothetical protein [Archaeoglobus profundus]ADB57191.1 hypothetical protein Arcpr_0119 [Archaeoglobus profundus DSM 5631]